MNKYNHKKGFSLIEVLVAISVIVLVIFSATSLVISIIRSNSRNINTLIAYGLAQEGIEAVRNMRDSDWLLGVRFDGVYSSVSQPEISIWGDRFTDGGFYAVNINSLERANYPISNPGELTAAAPWAIREIDALDPDNTKTLLKKYIDPNSGEVQFRHSEGFSFGDEDTPFHRYIKIENISSDVNKFQEMRVTSVVYWNVHGPDEEIKLTTELTDWNKG